MKKLILSFLLFAPFIGQSDTLDYWSVYLNDSLIGQFNVLTPDPLLRLDKESIRSTDTIFVIYGNDHPCASSDYYFAIKERERGIKLIAERRKQLGVKIPFPLVGLKNYEGTLDFECFVYEDRYGGEEGVYLALFRLLLE